MQWLLLQAFFFFCLQYFNMLTGLKAVSEIIYTNTLQECCVSGAGKHPHCQVFRNETGTHHTGI